MTEGQQYVFPGAIVASLILVVVLLRLTPAINTMSTPNISLNASMTTSEEIDVNEPENEFQENMIVNTSYSAEGCQVSRNFPENILQWCDLISHYGHEHGIDPDLLAALILQESGGNPAAYSHSGAVGLMQVMPKDGLAAAFMCQNGPCFKNRPAIAELEDPDFNVSYGTKMLAGLIAKYGNLRDALKSYGPMDVGYRYSDIVLGLYERYRD